MKVVNNRTVPTTDDLAVFGNADWVHSLVDMLEELANTLGATEDGEAIALAPSTGNAIAITGTPTTAFSVSGTSDNAAGRVLKGQMTVNNANYGDGYGLVEAELTLTGTSAGHVAASTSWINMTAGTHGAGGNFIAARNDGIYEESGATITGALVVFGARMQCVCSDTDAAGYFPWSINTSGITTTALIQLNTPAADVGLVTNAGSDAGTLIPFYKDSNGAIGYVKVYALA